MASHNLHTWTIGCLIGAFFDLAVAYLLLWVSASLFIPLKCLSFFEIYLPCSCDGHTSHNLCLYKLLFDWPVRSIYSVQNSAKNRFPFNLICLNDQVCSEFAESESRLQSYVDKQNGYDGKGKKIMNNQKQRANFRRRKKTRFGYGKSSTVLLDKSRQHSLAGSSNEFEISESSERLDPVSIIEDGPQDDGSVTEGLHPSEITRHVFEIEEEHRFSSNYAQAKPEIFGTDMKMLSQALDEEKALCMSLFMELEKERSAAATAADEAMAMIIRLQKEKASIEMELRQYQRMIEEKSAYDEEEVNVLKEILVRREKEKHLLEKEVEAYRHMEELSENEQSDNDDVDENNNREEREIIKTEPVKAYNGIFKEEDNGKFTVLETEPTIYDVHVIDEINDGPSTLQKKDVILNSSIDGNENFKLENEVEWLRERLSMMQQEKEKLTLSAERREKMNAQLQGLMNQLLEIKELGEPEWQAS